jgi:hypothetical protein
MSARTSRSIALAFTPYLAVALLALAACGGGDSTNASATATAPVHATSTQPPGNNTTNTEQATATSESTSSSGDVLSQLQALGGGVKQAKGKIMYTETATSGSTTSITYYSKPPNGRYDTTESDGSTTVLIETPATTYICTSREQICTATAGSGTGSAGLGLLSAFFNSSSIDVLVAAAQAQGISITRSSETIAGTDASCYSGENSGSAEKLCFSDSGVLLSEQTTDPSGSTTGLMATAYSSDVSDSDFAPPYPVLTIPAIATG